MKSDYTHITVILDRTGSMETIRDDTIGGFNAFLGEQKKGPGSATLTLVQFDTQDPYEVVCGFKPIQEVLELTRETYVPRAGTPLLDALGRGINELEKQLADMRPEDRPAKVIVAVITDGRENSSCEFRKDGIVKMIGEHQDNDGWQFVFLSADLASINDAMAYGIRGASSMSFGKSAAGTALAWASLSRSISGYREGRADDVSFGDEDRSQQKSSGR